MSILAVYHIKGGVGKTASAVNLAYLAASEGARTLICDLDPQAATTFYLRVKPRLAGGVDTLVAADSDLDAHIKGSDYAHLDLLPADLSLRHLDLALSHAKKSKKRLKAALAPLREQYDYIFLDCPPNLNLVAENIFRAADVVLCPVIPTTLASRTLDQLHAFLKDEKSRPRLLPFFSMVEGRKNLHREMMETIPRKYEVCSCFIPYLSEVERMGLSREPVLHTRPNSAASVAYRRLWREIKRRLSR